jgi:hypothetical protein
MATALPPAPTPIGATRSTTAAPAHAAPAISSAPPLCRLVGWQLRIAPFRIVRHALTYLSATEHEIDLRAVAPARYRVLAVHNFHVEDRHPDLAVCIAGVFLAALRSDATWEDPERFPVECRALALLCAIEVDATGPPPRLVEP